MGRGLCEGVWLLDTGMLGYTSLQLGGGASRSRVPESEGCPDPGPCLQRRWNAREERPWVLALSSFHILSNFYLR